MPKKYKVLLSAYACEPNRGSEPGIGWNWAIELSKQGYNVNVITRKNNREVIELELTKLEQFPNLHFYYHDLSNWMLRLKKLPFGVYFYYLFWQIGIVKLAKKIHQEKEIDLVHHITFGVFRQPSFLWKLKKPFIFGPVGGAEGTPHKLLKSLNFNDYLKEVIRAFVNHIYKYSPLLNYMFFKTDLILCKTSDTYKFIPKHFDGKKRIQIEIGINNIQDKKVNLKSNKQLKVLYVGRFIGWKGVLLAVDAVNLANKKEGGVKFTLIGEGKLKPLLKQKGDKQNINFIDWVTQEELFNLYSSYDCMLFPSFHDSSGNVILESFSFGLPVICLNLGGPAQLVDKSCGYVVDVDTKTTNQIVLEISNILLELKNDKKKILSLKVGAIKKAETYSWSNTVKQTYMKIKEAL